VCPPTNHCPVVCAAAAGHRYFGATPYLHSWWDAAAGGWLTLFGSMGDTPHLTAAPPQPETPTAASREDTGSSTSTSSSSSNAAAWCPACAHCPDQQAGSGSGPTCPALPTPCRRLNASRLVASTTTTTSSSSSQQGEQGVTGALKGALAAAGQQQKVAAMSEVAAAGDNIPAAARAPTTPDAQVPVARAGWDELTVLLMGADPATLSAAGDRIRSVLQQAASAAGLGLPCPFVNTMPIPGPVFGSALGTTPTSSYFTLLLRNILPAAHPGAAAGFRRYAGAQPWGVWRLSPQEPTLLQQLQADLGATSRGRDSSSVAAFGGGQLAPALQQLAGTSSSSSNPARSVASAAAAAIRRRMAGGLSLEAEASPQPSFPLPDLLPRTPGPSDSSSTGGSSPRCEAAAPEASSSETSTADAGRRLHQEAPGAGVDPSAGQVDPAPQQQQPAVEGGQQTANTTAADVPPEQSGQQEQQAPPPEANTTTAVSPSPPAGPDPAPASPDPPPAADTPPSRPPPQPEEVAAAGGPPGPGLPSLDAWSSILASGLLPGGPRAAAAAARGITLGDLGPDPTLRAAQGEAGPVPADGGDAEKVEQWKDSSSSSSVSPSSPLGAASWGASWGLPSLDFLLPRATSTSNTSSGDGSTPTPLAQLASIAAAAASTTASALTSRAALAAAAWRVSPAARDPATSSSSNGSLDGCTLPGSSPGVSRPPPEQLLAPAVDLLVGRLAAAAQRNGAAVAHGVGSGAALELAGGLDWGGDCLAARVDLCNGEAAAAGTDT
jgi:hypothetical protein